MLHISKLVVTRETVFSELGAAGERPVNRAVGLAVIANPFAGRFAEFASKQQRHLVKETFS